MSDITRTPSQDGSLLNFIERASRDDSFSLEKFQALLGLQQQVADREAKREFTAAMSACQAEMVPVARDARNSHLNTRYAKLEAIEQAIRPIYSRHGFSIRFGSAASPRADAIRVICTVSHVGGYSEDNFLDVPISTTGSQGGKMATTPVQAMGSAITDARRYLL